MWSYGPAKSWESQLWEFRDSHLGVPGQNAIWMWPLWRAAKNIIRGKVVVSPKSRLGWVLWVWVCLWFVLAPKVLKPCKPRCCLVCANPSEWISCLSLFLVPFQSSSMPFYPRSASSQGACLDSLLFRCFILDSHLSLSRSLAMRQFCNWPHHIIQWKGISRIPRPILYKIIQQLGKH
jgi:hypothetical protein